MLYFSNVTHQSKIVKKNEITFYMHKYEKKVLQILYTYTMPVF